MDGGTPRLPHFYFSSFSRFLLILMIFFILLGLDPSRPSWLGFSHGQVESQVHVFKPCYGSHDFDVSPLIKGLWLKKRALKATMSFHRDRKKRTISSISLRCRIERGKENEEEEEETKIRNREEKEEPGRGCDATRRQWQSLVPFLLLLLLGFLFLFLFSSSPRWCRFLKKRMRFHIAS